MQQHGERERPDPNGWRSGGYALPPARSGDGFGAAVVARGSALEFYYVAREPMGAVVKVTTSRHGAVLLEGATVDSGKPSAAVLNSGSTMLAVPVGDSGVALAVVPRHASGANWLEDGPPDGERATDSSPALCLVGNVPGVFVRNRTGRLSLWCPPANRIGLTSAASREATRGRQLSQSPTPWEGSYVKERASQCSVMCGAMFET